MWLAVTLFVVGTAAAQQTFSVAGGEQVPAEFGEFVVPAVRADPASPMLTLRYVRFRSTAANPKPPIVFLAGGPGDAATRAFKGMPASILRSLLAVADVVAFDQRGTGTSDPRNVTCPPGAPFPLDQPLDPAVYVASIRERLAECLPRLEAVGVRVAGLTTVESAADIDGLRQALGVPSVMLLAGSYGTHLALAAARAYPERIAAMALLGVEGPDDTLKRPSRVDAVLAAIDEAMPGLLAAVKTHVRKLTAAPWSKTLPNGQVVTIGAWDLQRRVSDALDSVARIKALPAAFDQMDGGDYSDVVRWAIPFRLPRPINVMKVAMDCASYASDARLAAVREEAITAVLGNAINVPLPDVCDTPGLPRLDDEFRTPGPSSVPTLFVSGTFDGRTPPDNAQVLTPLFSRGLHLVLPGASHGLFGEQAAMASVLRFFGQQ
jgi:pimeloyl-ACP methyl ester carboxylesterase